MSSYAPSVNAPEKDLSALAATLLLVAAPLIGFVYFVLFPFVATVLALVVVGEELAKAVKHLFG